MHSSRAVNLNWKLTAPHVLYSNRTRAMWQIEADLTGENYCGGGYCSEQITSPASATPARARAVVRPISRPRLAATAWTAQSFNIDACFNVFMTVAYDANGVWEIRPPKGKPGDYVVDARVAAAGWRISNCPILFNACNNSRLKPLTLEILK